MKLGTKLILALVVTLVVTMTIHGYLSIQQDQENLIRELRMGMGGYTRAVQAALTDLYGDHQNLSATRDFVRAVGPRGNIHGLIVYNMNAQPIAQSSSLNYPDDFPEINPTPVLRLDPRPVLRTMEGNEGYIRERGNLIYYRIEPLTRSDGQPAGAFVLARQGAEITRTIEARRIRILMTTSALVILFSLVVLIIVRRGITRPVNQLIERIREIGKGRWEQRVDIIGHDEVSSLAKEFNLMSEELERSYSRLTQGQQEKLKLERNLRHSERLASVGQLAAGLAHEIGTPLNIIGGRAESLLSRPRGPEELRQNLEIIRSQSDRIAGIVRQLLAFSRHREAKLSPVDLLSLVLHMRSFVEHAIEEKKVSVMVDIPDSLPKLHGDRDLLQQVFLNLFLNSLQAAKPGGAIKVQAQFPVEAGAVPVVTNGAERCRIRFEDDGAGIMLEHIGHVFDPFFTTKDVGEGTGLGLSVSYGIIKEHGGDIHVESEPGKFTRFTIDLPITAPL